MIVLKRKIINVFIYNNQGSELVAFAYLIDTVTKIAE